MRRLFVEHPATVGESYLEHLQAASGFGLKMVTAGFACLLHGLLPFLFIRTGSEAVTELHERMVTKRRRTGLVDESAAPSDPAATFENA
ncbi:MAG: DUF6356 family protein [Pseudomonadota bacterium]